MARFLYFIFLLAGNLLCAAVVGMYQAVKDALGGFTGNGQISCRSQIKCLLGFWRKVCCHL